MGTGTFYPEKKTKFFSGLKVPVPIVAPITTYIKRPTSAEFRIVLD